MSGPLECVLYHLRNAIAASCIILRYFCSLVGLIAIEWDIYQQEQMQNIVIYEIYIDSNPTGSHPECHQERRLQVQSILAPCIAINMLHINKFTWNYKYCGLYKLLPHLSVALEPWSELLSNVKYGSTKLVVSARALQLFR